MQDVHVGAADAGVGNLDLDFPGTGRHICQNLAFVGVDSPRLPPGTVERPPDLGAARLIDLEGSVAYVGGAEHLSPRFRDGGPGRSASRAQAGSNV